MTDFWTVTRSMSPFADADIDSDFAKLPDGSDFILSPGDQLEIDADRTVKTDAANPMAVQWIWLFESDRAGFVPHVEGNLEDGANFAMPWDPGIPKRKLFSFFDETITRAEFAGSCVLNALVFGTNSAYLYALAFLESGADWPDDKVTSPAAATGQLAAGTFRFLPASWQDLVARHGEEQFIGEADIIFPKAVTTVAAIAAKEQADATKEALNRDAKYTDLYLAHVFGIEAALSFTRDVDAGQATKVDALLTDAFKDLSDEDRAKKLNSILTRKADQLTDGGAPLSTSDARTRLVEQLDAAFDHVRAVAQELVAENPSGDTAVRVNGSGLTELGQLSEAFESNGDPAAIGEDSTGGFSYGKWQIATKVGTFDLFMTFLKTSFPAIHQTLVAAGDSAAAKAGTQTFKNAWRGLKGNPDFVPAQFNFIKATHYDKMLARLSQSFDTSSLPPAVHDVIWSVAVQHGPGNKIIDRAMAAVGTGNPAQLIRAIYADRSNVDKHFKNSTAKVKASVRRRFEQELDAALRMLG